MLHACCLSRSIELNAQSSTALQNRALCYLRMLHPDLALVDASRACALDPSYDKAFYRRAQALQDLGYLHDAIDAYA